MDLLKYIIIGGGCFWCTEAIFLQFDGIIEVKSGYSGGETMYPTYQEVCEGNTGHAEVIKIGYNPDIISLEDIVEIHLLSHDPTTYNRQGADVGSQYRSIIFYSDDKEKEIIHAVIKEVQKNFKSKIVTEVKPVEIFFEAEGYHQDYYNKNSRQPYCMFVISPKLEKIKLKYKDRVK